MLDPLGLLLNYSGTDPVCTSVLSRYRHSPCDAVIMESSRLHCGDCRVRRRRGKGKSTPNYPCKRPTRDEEDDRDATAGSTLMCQRVHTGLHITCASTAASTRKASNDAVTPVATVTVIFTSRNCLGQHCCSFEHEKRSASWLVHE